MCNTVCGWCLMFRSGFDPVEKVKLVISLAQVMIAGSNPVGPPLS